MQLLHRILTRRLENADITSVAISARRHQRQQHHRFNFDNPYMLLADTATIANKKQPHLKTG
eukprot:scaffold445_cov111-Cylindrotheca_fusiformis.AAC.1